MNQLSNQQEEPQTNQQEEPREKPNKADKAEAKLNELKDFLRDLEKKPIKEPFKLGRDAVIQLAKSQRDLFTDIREKESGNYIVSGLSRKVSETDFAAFCLAAGQALYNQSVQSENEETNSGISREWAPKISGIIGRKVYTGEIAIKLNDFCKLAYGVDNVSEQQRKSMATLLQVLHSETVKIQFPNSGDEIEDMVCFTRLKFKSGEDGAIYYWLLLNPIFCENVKRNFAELPQDITKRLTGATERKTAAHYRLIMLLAAQDKRKPFVRYIGTLLEELGIDEDAYKKNRRQTEKQILQICEDMKETGIIADFKTEEKEGRGGKKFVEKITFTLNPDFPTTRQKREEQKQDETGEEPQGE